MSAYHRKKALPDSKDPVLVLGSKPDSILPDISPVHIYAANAAAMRVKPYRELDPEVQLTCIVGGMAILEEYLQNIVSGSEPSRVITKNPCPRPLDDLFPEFKNKGVQTLDRNNKDSYYLQHSILGRRAYWGEWLKLTSQNVLKKPMRIPRLLYNLVREKYPRGTSAGMFCVIMAAIEFPGHPIVVSGISLQGGGHFNKVDYFTSSRAIIDRYLCRSLPVHVKKNLYTVDPLMSENGGVQLVDLSPLARSAGSLSDA